MFLYFMSECLKNEGVKPNARHLSGILFKNTVLNKTQSEECDRLWYNMSDDERETLKTSLLGALACDESCVMRAAGSAISAVALLEIPYGQWLDLIDTLCKNINHDLDYIREASLLTLGYICEELSKEHLQKEQADYIISAFLQSLKDNHANPKHIVQTIQGVYHSVKFAAPHFEEGYGGTIMDGIIQTLKYNDTKVRTIAMQCIVEIVRLYYEAIEPFMGDITEVTFALAQNDEHEVKTQAIEVWASLAEEEYRRIQRGVKIHHIIDRALDSLLQIIMSALQDQNFGNDNDDEEQWGSSVAAGCCLNLVSQVVKDRIVHPVAEFAAENLDKNSWEKKY